MVKSVFALILVATTANAQLPYAIKDPQINENFEYLYTRKLSTANLKGQPVTILLQNFLQAGATAYVVSFTVNGQALFAVDGLSAEINIGTRTNQGPSRMTLSGAPGELSLIAIATNPSSNAIGIFNTAQSGSGNISFRDYEGKGVAIVGIGGPQAAAYGNASAANRIAFGTALSTEMVILANNNVAVLISTSGHFEFMGSTPTLSDCGTAPSIVGTDTGGKITIGTGGTASVCNAKFANRWTFAPACFCNNETQVQLIRASSTISDLACSASAAFTASDVLSYLCFGRR